jgi:hypothetical protein
VNHAEFARAYRNGSIRVIVDPKAAARFVSHRLLLPLVMLPVLGIGTALALVGWLWTGFGIIGAATLAPMLIKRSAPHFVLTQSLEDAKFYADAVSAGVLDIRDS